MRGDVRARSFRPAQTVSSVFQWPVRVYYEDTDHGGVVYYANYLRFMERARTELLRSAGVEQDKLLAEKQLLFVIVEANLKYLKPARFNDMLCVTAEISERRGSSLRFVQQVRRDDLAGELLCEGSIRAACLEAGSFRPRRIPEELLRD